MDSNLKIVLVAVSLVMFYATLKAVRNDKLPIRYSLVWLLSGLILLFVAVFTNAFSYVSSLIGFQVSSNLVIGIFISLLLLITMMLTKVVSEQNKKITLLIEEVSLLKEQKEK